MQQLAHTSEAMQMSRAATCTTYLSAMAATKRWAAASQPQRSRQAVLQTRTEASTGERQQHVSSAQGPRTGFGGAITVSWRHDALV